VNLLFYYWITPREICGCRAHRCRSSMAICIAATAPRSSRERANATDFWRGTAVPQWLIEDPSRNARSIHAEANEDIRRYMLERLGDGRGAVEVGSVWQARGCQKECVRRFL
jgi:hypothetical protein